MKRRSIITSWAAHAAWAATVAAPSVGRASASLTLWTMQLSPFHDDYVKGVLNRFEALHPGVRLKWVDVAWAEMERKVLASLAAGTAPDVVNLNPQFSARLAELGALEDPRQHLLPAEISAFLPAAWQANQLGGVPFALPWYLSTTVQLVRQDLLARAGVQAPSSFEELPAVAQALRQHTQRYAWFAPMDGSLALETLVSMTGTLLSPDGCRPAFESPEGVQAFNFLHRLYRERWMPPTVLTEGHRGAVQQFLAGEVAMMPTGMQFISQVQRTNPQLHPQLRVMPQWLRAGTPPNLAVMNLAVPRASPHPALAMRLAQYLANTENQLALVRRVPVLPSTRDSYEDADFTRTSGDPLLDEARRISTQQVFEGAVQVPPLRHYGKLRASFVRQLQLAMTGRSSAQQAVAEISRVWVPLLGCRA
ncbi:MAG: ABC transporter substrate-binding protein [Betaproteobacteria bacterium]